MLLLLLLSSLLKFGADRINNRMGGFFESFLKGVFTHKQPRWLIMGPCYVVLCCIYFGRKIRGERERERP